jgi:hypothetical protein
MRMTLILVFGAKKETENGRCVIRNKGAAD